MPDPCRLRKNTAPIGCPPSSLTSPLVYTIIVPTAYTFFQEPTHEELRKNISFLMVVVLFVVMVTGACGGACAFEPPSGSPTIQKASCLSPLQNSCPECPVDEHSVPDHCDCSCACHATLMSLTVQPVRSPLYSPLIFHETQKYPPEVYLSRFVPPQYLV